MEDPKRQAWMYVVAGVVAVIAAIYFLTSAPASGGDFSLLDWAILGMGIVALYRGARMFLKIRQDGVTPVEPGESKTFRRKPNPPEDEQPRR